MSIAMPLIVYVSPVAKSRPKFSVRNGIARAYTPAKTVRAEDAIRAAWLAEMGHLPFEGALSLHVRAYIQMPKSMPKKYREQAIPATRPDVDNYLKTVMDALNGVAWKDDSQVASASVMKRYAKGAPHWEIEVNEL